MLRSGEREEAHPGLRPDAARARPVPRKARQEMAVPAAVRPLLYCFVRGPPAPARFPRPRPRFRPSPLRRRARPAGPWPAPSLLPSCVFPAFLPAQGTNELPLLARADWSASGTHADIFPGGAGKIPEWMGAGCACHAAPKRGSGGTFGCASKMPAGPVLGPGGAHSPCRGSFSGRKSFDCRIGCFPAGAGKPENVRPLLG